MRKIGIHLSTAGGLVNAVREGIELGVNTVQFFLKNPNRWVYRDYTENEIQLFREEAELSGIEFFAHSGYLINLSGKGENLRKSIDCAADELKRAAQLGIGFVVFHPGSCPGGFKEGIQIAADTINRILDKNILNVKILLETTSGQGNSIGHEFPSLAEIILKTEQQDKIFTCIDTCHVHASGYNLSDKTGVDFMLGEFNKYIGFDKLKLIHLNDSKKNAGSKIDRHEHIGMGTIGIQGFTALLGSNMISDVPLILETPKKGMESADKINLDSVRKISEGV
jgi:deoxyribonuclease-4